MAAVLNSTIVTSTAASWGLDGLLDSAAGLQLPGGSALLAYVAAATGAYALLEQLRFRLKRGRKGGKLVPGPSSVVPFLGGLVEMVMNPYSFWEKQKENAERGPGFSYNSLMGKFILTVTDAEKCRELMSVNDPQRMLMVLHPSAKTVLGANNLAFTHGEYHKQIRKSFLSLFTRKALSTYIELQDAIIREHIEQWLADGAEHREIRNLVRDMNQQTSQDVFIGPYLDTDAERKKFGQAYRDMTDAFLAFPICFPGTAVWRGRQARFHLFHVLERASRRALEYIQSGGEPRCLLDFWAQKCVEEISEAAAEGKAPPAHCAPDRMGDAMLDFLFASQDASTASLVWTLTLLADHPDVLAKVREEQLRLRPDPSATLNGDVVREMSYTRQVVKEVLRLRAPAPMVPQMAYTDYPLSADYAIPKGTLVFPSVNAACMQGFTDGHKFDPDRFSPERKEDIKFAKNMLTFGAGPHYCVGKEYASNHLMCFLAIISLHCDWTRQRTPASDDWVYLPTIYPADSLISLERRA